MHIRPLTKKNTGILRQIKNCQKNCCKQFFSLLLPKNEPTLCFVIDHKCTTKEREME